MPLTGEAERLVRSVVEPLTAARRNLSIAVGVLKPEGQEVLGFGPSAGGEVPAGDPGL